MMCAFLGEHLRKRVRSSFVVRTILATMIAGILNCVVVGLFLGLGPGMLIGAIAGFFFSLPFVPAVLFVVGLGRRVGRAGHGTIVDAADRRGPWAAAFTAIALGCLLALPDHGGTAPLLLTWLAIFGLVALCMLDLESLGESAVYRTVGMMDVALGEIDKQSPEATKEIRKAIEEYAVECSIIKVWGSEALDRAVDTTVQVYGGYGFVEEYPAERAYRDSRVNRIFEGTNEINRLIITGFLLKRAMTGQLPLMPAIKRLMDEVLGGPSKSETPEGPLGAEKAILANAKKIALFTAGAASQKYMQKLVDQQEIMGALADIIIETYCMESAVLRAEKVSGRGNAELAIAMTQVYVARAMETIEAAARKVIAAIAEGDMLRTQMAILRRLLKYDPVNTIALREKIAARVIEQGKYVTA
ncbi:MAG: acyl-CoA dehydrogenase family protein, partial [Terriglobales bacterium]